VRVALAVNVSKEGGVWRHVVDVARQLESRGHEVSIGLPIGASRLREEVALLGLRVERLAPSDRVDVWHGHLADTYDQPTFRALLVARRMAGVIVLTEHLPRTDSSDAAESTDASARSAVAWPAKTAFKRLEYLLADCVVCVSEASRRFVIIRYGVKPHKIVTVTNGLEVSAAPAPWPSGPSLFVAVGAVIVQKGFDVLMDASEFSSESWRVKVVGDGPHLHALRTQAKKRRLRVEFVGQSTDVPSSIAAATALVVPSRWEAWPYVALEAMDQGRPVVASRIDGLAEIVDHCATGTLVDPGDPHALAHALDNLAGDPARAKDFGRAGHERVKTFTLDRMMDELVRTYENALHPDRRDSSRLFSA
jgi:glycosyltransferase involved in cell wall biosynthesis